MKRRDFLKTAALGTMAAGSTGIGGMMLGGCSSSEAGRQERFNFNRLGNGGGIRLSFEPYELQLCSFSRHPALPCRRFRRP